MQSSARVAASHGPTRIQVALAAAWLVLSLAIGGAVSARSAPDGAAPDVPRTATP